MAVDLPAYTGGDYVLFKDLLNISARTTVAVMSVISSGSFVCAW